MLYARVKTTLTPYVQVNNKIPSLYTGALQPLLELFRNYKCAATLLDIVNYRVNSKRGQNSNNDT